MATNTLTLKGSASVTDNTLWNVKLAEKGDAVLSVARVVMKWLGLSLSAARDLVNSAPCLLVEKLSKERSTIFGQALEAVGATVNLVDAGSGAEEDVTDDFDDLATEGDGIYSNMENLTIEVSGDYAVYGTAAGIHVDKNTVIKGKGATLLLTGGTHGLHVGEGASVSIEDGLSLTGVGRREWGVRGDSKVSCGLYVSDASTCVKAYGGIGTFSFLQLNDNLKITEPEKAQFYSALGIVSDTTGDTAYIVTIQSPYDPADVNRDGTVDSADIVAVIKAMK
ncbi:MAG: ribosomal protein L7/L12 [Bacteroidaceae bacterium]|nr:ribosomal protein L7/L12 [Bacteroidaceae bacterium]